MFALIALLALPRADAQPTIQEDSFGVKKIVSTDWEAGFRAFGRVVAQDRLWQLEMSRRLARGELSEISATYRRTDEATLKQAYTDDELQAQFDTLSPKLKSAFRAYAEGVNDEIAFRKISRALPKGYEESGIVPRPWTVLDSAAIGVNLIRRFGTGGAGELRGLALLEFLKTQPVKGREIEALNDIAWLNDPAAPVTQKEASSAKPPQIFTKPTVQQTRNQLSQLPVPGLLELAGAVALTTGQSQRVAAEKLSVANKWGSYAIAVSAARSKTGRAFLLGGPQMGHSTPSVIHECALEIGDYKAQGMDVPGIPVIAAGTTPHHAWTVTTGAADIEDIFASRLEGDDAYKYGGQTRHLQKVSFRRKDAGGAEFAVDQLRTHHGPVVLLSKSARAVFSRQSSLWLSELSGIQSIFDSVLNTDPVPTEKVAQEGAPCFNFFYATRDGRIGWRFTGKIPVRRPGLDPRLPIPDAPENEWKGFIPYDQMPHASDPKSGLLVNWNNKPAAWFPNGDTPAWGRFFRSRYLESAIPNRKLNRSDLEKAIWTIARTDTQSPEVFLPLFLANAEGRVKAELEAWDGTALDGSIPSLVYRTAVIRLRAQLFSPLIGSLTSPQLFNQALQPEVIWNALQGKTGVDYRAKRSPSAIVKAALKEAEDLVWGSKAGLAEGYKPGVMTVRGEVPIPYSDRGTYIQITEMLNPPLARNVASPGVQEAGPHSLDQTPLARSWTYKPCWRLNTP